MLAVIIQAVRIVVVVRAEQPPPARLLGHHDFAQAAVGEGFVPQEGDGAQARLWTLVDLEDHVDAVLVQLHQLGRNRRRDSARQPVQFDDLADVFLHLGAGIDTARSQGDFLAQLVLADRAVPLQHDLVDDRVLDDLDDQIAVRLNTQLDVGEQLRALERANRHVQHDGIDRVAGLDRQIGQDRGLIDPLVATDQDTVDDDALRRWRGLNLRAQLTWRDRRGRRWRLGQGCAVQASGNDQGQGAGPSPQSEGSAESGARVGVNHWGNHRGLASAQETSPPRNWNRFSFCRSFQVANNIKPASKARPTRYPAS